MYVMFYIHIHINWNTLPYIYYFSSFLYERVVDVVIYLTVRTRQNVVDTKSCLYANYVLILKRG